MSETVNITPTWEGLIPLLVEVAANGATSKGRKEAMGELLRLARIVDQHNLEAAAMAEVLTEAHALTVRLSGMAVHQSHYQSLKDALSALAKATGEAQL